jgi:hypothetical protein
LKYRYDEGGIFIDRNEERIVSYDIRSIKLALLVIRVEAYQF